MKKIAIIVQRYGIEVNGGAEFHARILAEKLSKNYDITILTTTALDYQGWANHYAEGHTEVNGLKVIRFSTEIFSKKKMRKARRAIFKKKKYFKIIRFLGLFDLLDKKFNISTVTKEDGDNWLKGQGPFCPDLLSFLRKNKEEYDVFIFFTYLYYPTVMGLPIVNEKAIFIPTAHDEPPLYTKPYENLFSQPKFIMYNTQSEKELVENHFKEYCQNTDVAGVGIEEFVLDETYCPAKEFQYDFPYFVYIGRIDRNKGCRELVEYFNLFCKENPSTKLVMIGKNNMDIIPNKNIILTGFINEEDKYYLLKNSLGLILPSKYESLSMVTLEAMACGKIPLVNADCIVLKQHILNSGTGFYFSNYMEFKKYLNKIINLSEEEREEYSLQAKRYVKENYSWSSILNKFDQAIDFVTKNKK
ncbi:glycosyltransferase family 4 protein [Bergeyella zoohelcum]|uniref:Group 1 glycosyl transferase n=1 Tax=Bergeyella zoohelcum TaxID=1015 RepID=A0A7Z8YNK3_9FLAO|nr:glycosyltransferase [Bergeyella zoohelcum]VDH03924.1 group 1 glycosyl transferase [Bergeyella zoohelcum]